MFKYNLSIGCIKFERGAVDILSNFDALFWYMQFEEDIKLIF